MVYVFTQPNCQPCNLTKRHLDKHEIPYTECELDDGMRATALEAGIMSAPVVQADGQMWGGFRPDRIDALIS